MQKVTKKKRIKKERKGKTEEQPIKCQFCPRSFSFLHWNTGNFKERKQETKKQRNKETNKIRKKQTKKQNKEETKQGRKEERKKERKKERINERVKYKKRYFWSQVSLFKV